MRYRKELNLTEAENKLVVARDWGKGAGKSFNGYKVNSYIK